MLELERLLAGPSHWIPVGLFLLALGGAWLALRRQVRGMRRRNELLHAGRWEEVTLLYEREFRGLHPLRSFVRGLATPGGLEAQYSLHLGQIGRLDEALHWSGLAVERSAGRPAIHGSALAVHGLTLGRLGRYPEAFRTAELLHRDPRSGSAADYLESMVALSQGNLDLALARAERARQDPKRDLARIVVSMVHELRGDFGPAMEVLVGASPGAREFYSPAAWAAVRSTAEGRALAQAQERRWEGVFEPSRFFQAARVSLAEEQWEEARFALEKGRTVVGGHPILLRQAAEIAARLRAAAGDAAGAERELEAARALLARFPDRASSAELGRSAGRVYLRLGSAGRAGEELEKALRASLHPIEKHLAAYWLARAREAAGDRPGALELDRQVAGDGIPSRFAALSRAKIPG